MEVLHKDGKKYINIEGYATLHNMTPIAVKARLMYLKRARKNVKLPYILVGHSLWIEKDKDLGEY